MSSCPLTVSPSPPLPPFPPPSLLLYCTRLIVTEKAIIIDFLMKLRFLPIYFKLDVMTGLLFSEQYILVFVSVCACPIETNRPNFYSEERLGTGLFNSHLSILKCHLPARQDQHNIDRTKSAKQAANEQKSAQSINM